MNVKISVVPEEKVKVNFKNRDLGLFDQTCRWILPRKHVTGGDEEFKHPLGWLLDFNKISISSIQIGLEFNQARDRS